MSLATPYPAQLHLQGTRKIARWRPFVQWLLAVPHLLIAYVLSMLRVVLTLIAFFTVLFTGRIPRPLFDVIAMSLRYEWRVASYVLFLHEDYPPFDFQTTADDDRADPHTIVTFAYPEQMSRWRPLVKWLFAVPHYVALAVFGVAATVIVIMGFFAVLFTGSYPQRLRDILVGIYRHSLRVQSYVGLLTDTYPPFSLQAD